MPEYFKKVPIWAVALCGVLGLGLLAACDQNQSPQQLNQPQEQEEQKEQEGEPLKRDIEPQE